MMTRADTCKEFSIILALFCFQVEGCLHVSFSGRSHKLLSQVSHPELPNPTP